MKRLAIAVLIAGALALTPGARAQEPRLPGAEDLRFVRLSVEQGLSHSVVREAFQDHKGFLWFGTSNGSLAAGCDGHLTKPIRKPVLFEAIDRYARGIGEPAGPGHRGARAEVRPRASGRMAPAFVPPDPSDPGRISITVATEVAPYIPGYLTVTREQLAAGVKALEAGDCLPLRTLGHNLKGSGASFGLDEISRMGWRLERTAARGEIALAREAANALTAYLERLVVT